MLMAFAGLIGFVFAGFVAEAAIAMAKGEPEDEAEDPADATPDASAERPGIPDWATREGDAPAAADPGPEAGDGPAAGLADNIMAGLDDGDATAVGPADDPLAERGGDGPSCRAGDADPVDGGAEQDRLSREGGEDRIASGTGDRAPGSEGADRSAITGWEGAVSRIDGFDAATEQIMVFYDPADHPNPQLELAPSTDGSGTMVLLDGVPVAEVPGVADLRPEAIRLAAEPQIAA